MLKCGLIGASLKHSYSAEIHALLARGEYSYGLAELSEDEVGEFVVNGGFDAFNVTIPYKKAVMSYLDALDGSAELCGAVNTVVRRGGKTTGYNTDFFGFAHLLRSNGIDVRGGNAVILGDGGTAAMIKTVLKTLGTAQIGVISRRGEVNYGNYRDFFADADILINASPVGMCPENGQCLVDLKYFPRLTAVADVIYNPLITKLGFLAAERGVKFCGGLSMLVAQAAFAAGLFKGDTDILRRLRVLSCGNGGNSGGVNAANKENAEILIGNADINRYAIGGSAGKTAEFTTDGINKTVESVIRALKREKRNIVLIGMPGSGKTAVGRAVATLTGREFIDTDAEIEIMEKLSVPSIFERYGEARFRETERTVTAAAGKLSGRVIASGGGTVLDRENYYALKQNGIIVYVRRDLRDLAVSGRPLSAKFSASEIFEKRKNLYERYADVTVDNDADVAAAAAKVAEAARSFD
ncbi:MAG: hypothetical protein LBP79_00405 [Clostridiales bacterium]|jgi:shikimate dehydrogenase|nr:hypothetical protein [Clostridiales bacterium]